MTETPDDDDVFAAEADNGRELAHAIVYVARIADRFTAEEVFVEDRNLVWHAASVMG